MTREEMIRKVCEGVVKNAVDGEDCMLCFGYQRHTPDCPSVLSEKLLAEPVIEVGDVVKIQESDDEYYVCRIVQQYGYSYPWYCLSKESPWSEHTKKYNKLTIVRKGNQS